MSWELIVSVVGLLVLPFVGFIWIQVRRVIGNELAHIQESLQRIESKLDEHLSWHLRKP